MPGSPEAYAALQRAMNVDLPRDVRLEALRQSLFAPGNDPTSWLDGWHATAIATQGAALRATPEHDWADAGSAQVLVVQGLDDVLAPPVNGRELVGPAGSAGDAHRDRERGPRDVARATARGRQRAHRFPRPTLIPRGTSQIVRRLTARTSEVRWS